MVQIVAEVDGWASLGAMQEPTIADHSLTVPDKKLQHILLYFVMNCFI